jgi:hypothetical protein
MIDDSQTPSSSTPQPSSSTTSNNNEEEQKLLLRLHSRNNRLPTSLRITEKSNSQSNKKNNNNNNNNNSGGAIPSSHNVLWLRILADPAATVSSASSARLQQLSARRASERSPLASAAAVPVLSQYLTANAVPLVDDALVEQPRFLLGVGNAGDDDVAVPSEAPSVVVGRDDAFDRMLTHSVREDVDDAAVPVMPTRDLTSSGFTEILPLIDQLIDTTPSPQSSSTTAASWQATTKRGTRSGTITIGAAKLAKAGPPPLPEKSDFVKQQMLVSSPSLPVSAPTTPSKVTPAMLPPASKLTTLKRSLQRATVGLTLSAHPTLRRLNRAGNDDSEASTTAVEAKPAPSPVDAKPVQAKYRLPLLERYRDRLRGMMVRLAVQLGDIDDQLQRAEQDESTMHDVLQRFMPSPLHAEHATRIGSRPLDAASVRVVVSTTQLSAVALVPGWAWARGEDAREATLRDAPCAELARRAQRLVLGQALSQRAAKLLGTLRVTALRNKLAVVDARIDRLNAAERGERLLPSDDQAVMAPLRDDFFESLQQIEARDDAILDAIANDSSLRSEADAARAAYVERCQYLHRLTDRLRTTVVQREVAALLSRDAAPHEASSDEFDTIVRDLRAPQGKQLDRLCQLVSFDGGDGDITPRDVVGFLDEFAAALAVRYEVSPERVPLLATLTARCVSPMIAHDCGLLLERTPSAPSAPTIAAFVTGCGVWRERTGDALGVDAALWTGLVQRQEAMVAAGVLRASGSDQQPCLLPDALTLLQSLECVVAATDILRVLQLTVAAICERASVALRGAAVGADALFPLVVHVVSHTNMREMPLLLAVASEFGSESELMTELGYCLTTLSAAVHHITTAK